MDDRDFNEWARSNGVKPRGGANYITFQEHLRIVIADKSRSDELANLIRLFGAEVLEGVLEGKTLIQARDFVKAPKVNNSGLQPEKQGLSTGSESSQQQTIFGTSVPGPSADKLYG